MAALRAQIAEAARAMPPTVDGRDGRPCTPQEAVAALLTWAGDDEAKLRRALRRALELTTPRVAAAHAQPPGSPRVAAPRVRPRWRPPASPWDPNAPKGRPRAGRR